MEQKVKVLSISINKKELEDIRASFERMQSSTDFDNMATAINVLNPSASNVSPDMLRESLESSYVRIVESLGESNADGSIDVDLLLYPCTKYCELGYVLSLSFDKDKEFWLWTLNIEVASIGIYD